MKTLLFGTEMSVFGPEMSGTEMPGHGGSHLFKQHPHSSRVFKRTAVIAVGDDGIIFLDVSVFSRSN